MVALDITETSKALAVSGGYVVVVGLVSYFVKEKLYMAESLLATLAGIIFGPVSLNWFAPNSWSIDSNYLTLQIARIIIAIQVLFTGISLPKAYLRKEWLSLVTLLGPIMTIAWFICSLLVWGLIPGLTFLESLVIGACVTPTDPVLANSICKGRFAEKHVPVHVRNIIVAEAGANDGLGFPFLYIPLYLILIHEPTHPWHSVGGAILEWLYNIVLYQIVLSCVIGAVIGYVARKVLRFSEERHLIDHESFLSFGVALTFFTLGVVGIIGSDDILCCFVVGNSFTWDDWFRQETEDHAFQDVIDQLLNSGVFLYIGAIMPWGQFGNFEQITPWRLVILGVCVMLARRLPWVMILSRYIPALPTWREAAFAGFFGPIGVGALFYTQVALEVLPDDGTRSHLRAVLYPVNLFIILTSIVVHGITIPIAKGFQRARTMTRQSSKSMLSESDRVSRLPPPLPLGSEALRRAAEAGVAADSSDNADSMLTRDPMPRTNSYPAIRFNLDATPAILQSSKLSGATEAIQPGTSGQSTPIRPSTPSHREGREDLELSPTRRIEPGSRSSTPPRRPTHRNRSSEAQPQTWMEGENEVTESAGGETVTVKRTGPPHRFSFGRPLSSESGNRGVFWGHAPQSSVDGKILDSTGASKSQV